MRYVLNVLGEEEGSHSFTIVSDEAIDERLLFVAGLTLDDGYADEIIESMVELGKEYVQIQIEEEETAGDSPDHD